MMADHLLETTLQAERLRLHAGVLPSSMISSTVLGGGLAVLLWEGGNHQAILLWLASLLLALAARTLTAWAQRRAPQGAGTDALWLRRHRLCFLAHGLSWALAAVLLLPHATPSQFNLLAIALVAMATGSLIATTFDVAAAAFFVAPTLTPLVLTLLASSEDRYPAMGIILVLLACSGFLNAIRTQRIVRESVRSRLAEAEAASAARASAEAAEQARQALAEQHYLLPLLLRTTQQGFWYIDNSGVTLDLNPAMCGLLGRPREAVMGHSVFEFFSEADLHIIRAEIAARQTGKTGGYEIGITRPDGTRTHCFNNATPIHDGQGQKIGSIGLWTDLTERKLAEQQLEDTTAQLRRKSDELQLTLDSIDQGIVSIDSTRRIGVFNRRMLELLDLPASLMTAQTTIDDIVRFQSSRGDFSDDGSFVDVNGQRVQAHDGGLGLPPLYVRRMHSGALIEVRSRALSGGGLVRTYADVSAYVGALETLRKHEAGQRTLLDAFPGYIAVVDQDHVYQHVNDRLAALIGRPAAQIVGQHLREVLGEHAFSQLAPEFVNAAAGNPAGNPSTLERAYPATSARARTDLEVRHIAGPVTPDGKQLFYVFSIDITARKQAEAERLSLEARLRESQKQEAIAALEGQLRESQKMEAIGTLAGGIAHDFNNIIATILGNTELARQDARGNAAAIESLDEIRKAGSRARDLVQKILSFSRRQPTARKPLALDAVINESVRLLRATLPARVVLTTALDHGVPDVTADATQMQQVLINLVTNAMQAMRGRPGQITISLAAMAPGSLAASPQPALRALHARHAGAVVQISVSDDGPGMAPETVARVFDPFFTTKPVGEGTGLGLSVVHGIVHGHEGEIVLDSTPGVGSRFSLYLPAGTAVTTVTVVTAVTTVHATLAAPATAPAAVPATAPSSTAPTTAPTTAPGRRLLYLDDEEALVFLVKRLLERHGWKVSAHINQRDALDALQADPAGFDLLVTDYNMPGMSGLDVLREARQIRADLPVALASGFIDDELRTQALSAGVRELIFKASALEDFCATIETLAAQTAASPAIAKE